MEPVQVQQKRSSANLKDGLLFGKTSPVCIWNACCIFTPSRETIALYVKRIGLYLCSKCLPVVLWKLEVKFLQSLINLRCVCFCWELFFLSLFNIGKWVGLVCLVTLTWFMSSWWWRASILGRETTQVMIQSPTEHRQVFAKMFSFMTRPDLASCYHSDQRIWEAPWRGITKLYPYSGESNNANVWQSLSDFARKIVHCLGLVSYTHTIHVWFFNLHVS